VDQAGAGAGTYASAALAAVPAKAAATRATGDTVVLIFKAPVEWLFGSISYLNLFGIGAQGRTKSVKLANSLIYTKTISMF
jgi:hypothetical protein